MKKIKKILVLSALSVGITNADYRVTVPMDGQYINFTNAPTTPTETWVVGTPVLGEWTDVGDIVDCSLSPSVAEQSTGVRFTQTKSCSQPQEQTVRTPETSSLTNEVRYVDTINKQDKPVSSTQNAIGERYTNIIKVGYYTLPGWDYRGYLNPNNSSYPESNNMYEVTPSSLTPNTIAGLSMRWVLAFNNGDLLVATSDASVNSVLESYSITMNGITCSLKWKMYNGLFLTGEGCFNLSTVEGQEIKMDIRLK